MQFYQDLKLDLFSGAKLPPSGREGEGLTFRIKTMKND